MKPTIPAIPVEKAAEVADAVDSLTIALLVVAVIALVGFVVWLGRELLASRLSVRMLSENQRLARREAQHRKALHSERSRRWFGTKSGERVKTEPTPEAPPPAPVAQLKARRADPPPLPAPDWSDSRIFTEEIEYDDLPPPAAVPVEAFEGSEYGVEPPPPEVSANDTDSGEYPLNPLDVTEPLPLVQQGRTAVWPHRKLPPIEK
jgi:hypothetical protein